LAQRQPEDIRKLLRLAEEVDLKEAAKTSQILAVLEQRKNQFYVVKAVLRRVEGSSQTEDYGDIYFRRWTAGEVEELISSPVYQKSVMIPEVGKPLQITQEEAKAWFELKCDFWARVSPQNSGITKEKLVELGNWALTDFVFSQIARKSGLDTALVEDITDFFLQGRENTTATSSSTGSI